MTMEGTCVVISSSTASSEASRPRHDDDEEQHDEESCMSVSVKELQDLRNQVVQMRGDQKQRRGSSASSVSSLGEHSFRGNVPCTTTNKEDQMVLTTADKASSDRRKMFRLAILSNILFVLATCFYIGKSHSHLHWMRDSRDIPKSVLMADDDLTWRNYLTSQSQQKRQQETRKLRKRDDKMQKKDETNPQQMTDDFVEMTVDYNEYRWVDLPANIRHALIVLGHNERTWEAQANVPTDKLKWSELKKAQQNAAEVLGYTQETWDAAEKNQGKGDENDEYSLLTDLWASKDEPQAVEEGAEEVEDDTIVESSASSSTSTEPVTAAPVTTTAPRDTPLTDVADTNNMESPTQAPKSKTQPPSPAPTPASNTASTIDMSDYNLDDLDLLQNGDNIASMDGVNGASQQVLYFLASSCMLAVGFLGWVREQQIFHIWMVQGALFGVLSALSMTISDFGTLILRTLSVHCFLVEAIFLLWLRSTLRPLEELKLLSYALWAADLFFAVGTIVQIALVYWLHFSDGEALYELNYADGDVFSSWCWGISAMLHLVGTVYLTTNQKVNRSIEESLLKEEENEDGERYSIQHGHHVTNVVLP